MLGNEGGCCETIMGRKKRYVRFNPAKHNIADTCARDVKELIPYYRKYGKLSQSQLLDLIACAKANRWQALDLTCCGLSELPTELQAHLFDCRNICSFFLLVGRSAPHCFMGHLLFRMSCGTCRICKCYTWETIDTSLIVGKWKSGYTKTTILLFFQGILSVWRICKY